MLSAWTSAAKVTAALRINEARHFAVSITTSSTYSSFAQSVAVWRRTSDFV